jgi:hypothetical protein
LNENTILNVELRLKNGRPRPYSTESIERTPQKAKPQVQNIHFTVIGVPPAHLSAPQTSEEGWEISRREYY